MDFSLSLQTEMHPSQSSWDLLDIRSGWPNSPVEPTLIQILIVGEHVSCSPESGLYWQFAGESVVCQHRPQGVSGFMMFSPVPPSCELSRMAISLQFSLFGHLDQPISYVLCRCVAPRIVAPDKVVGITGIHHQWEWLHQPA